MNRTSKGNRIPTAAPTPFLNADPCLGEASFVTSVKPEEIEFKEIFSDKNIAVFEMKTETYFPPESITIEQLQKFSGTNITSIDFLSKEVFEKIRNKVANATNTFGLFDDGVKKIQKSGTVENYALSGPRYENSSSYKNYFIVAVGK